LLVWLIEEGHKSTLMAKSSFLPIFELQQIGDEWQFRVHCAEGAKEYIKGFKSRVDAEKWRTGDERRAWLKQRGYAD
jgi:hypothetical protein